MISAFRQGLSELGYVEGTNIIVEYHVKTAKALGVDIPPPLFARADEVIE
jgi:hypothetical protein